MKTFFNFPLENTEKAKPVAIIILVIFTIIIPFLAFNFLYPSGFWKPLAKLTGQLINKTTQAYFFMILFAFSVIFFIGKITLRQTGLEKEKLAPALLIFALFLLLVNLTEIPLSYYLRGKTVLNPGWKVNGGLAGTGQLIDQFFGNVVFEEVVFRGFLLMQIAFLFNKRINNRPVMWICSIITISLLFGLIHVPVNMHYMKRGFLPALSATTMQMIFGVLFSLFFLRTGNLFLTMFFHAFLNLELLHVVKPFGVSGYFSVHSAEVVLFFIVMMILGNALEKKIRGRKGILIKEWAEA